MTVWKDHRGDPITAAEWIARGGMTGDTESSRTAASDAGVQDGGQATGMSLRDHFAAHALNGIVSRNPAGETSAAEVAYRYADAMLKERDKRKP